MRHTGSNGDAPFHLFLVHSHITDIVARGVVRQRGLDPEHVGFLATRGFSSATGTDIRIVPFDFELVPRKRKQRPTIRQGWRTLATIDARLRLLTGGSAFHFYTPQTMEPIAQVVRRSPGCRGFSFIEEGLHSYCTRAEIALTHPPRTPKLWERLAYRNRTRKAQFFDPGHCHAYGVSDAVFPDLDNRVVLVDVLRPTPPGRVAGIDHVLVFDSLSVYRRVALESLLAALSRLFERLRSERVAMLHYKLHPAQVDSPEQAAVEAALRDSGIPVRRLDDELSLEGLALARPAATFYVNLSSVGLYAALFGARVWSFAPWVAVAEPGFQRYIDLTPRVFFDRVGMLN